MAGCKQGLDYFPFDVGFLKDRKFRKLRMQFGAVGILVYQSLLCMIYRDEGYFLDYGEDKQVDIIWEILNDVDGKYRIKQDTVIEMIDCMAESGLFDPCLYGQKILTSKRIQENFYKITMLRKQPIVDFGKWLLTEEEMKAISERSFILRSFQNYVKKEDYHAKKEDYHEGFDTKESKGKESKEKKKEGHSPTPARHKYGEFKHVLLSDEEVDKLKKEYGDERMKRAVRKLDEYMETRGQKYKNCYLAMKKWVFTALEEDDRRGKASVKKSSFHNYEQKSGFDYDEIQKRLREKAGG